MKIKFFLSGGHGAQTAGKRSPDGKLREYHFNNPTTQAFKKIMEQYEGVEVIHVNDLKGVDTPLKARTDIANAFYNRNIGDIKKGILKVYYVSFHANAMGNNWQTKATGSETLVYSGGSEAYKIAQLIEQETQRLTGQKSRGVKVRGDDLHELRETKMPAVLHEAGFMDNKKDFDLLMSDSFRVTVASGVANAFIKHLGLKKKAGAAPPIKPMPAPSPTPQQKPNNGGTSDDKGDGLYYVQVGAFSSQENAEARKKELEKAGYPAIIKKGD